MVKLEAYADNFSGVEKKWSNDSRILVKSLLKAIDEVESTNVLQVLTDNAWEEGREDVATMDAIDWWSTYGSEILELAKVAKKVTNVQMCFTSILEYHFQFFITISYHTKRYRLNQLRARRHKGIRAHIHTSKV